MQHPYVRIIFISIACLILSLPISPASAKPLAIGIITPLTGADAPLGQSVSQAVRIAHALKPAVLETPIELHFFDTESDDDLTSRGAGLLIKKENVAAIIDASPDSGMFPGRSVAAKARTPLLYPFVTSSGTDSNQYTFVVGPLDALEARAAALFAKEIQGAGKAAVMMDISQDYSIRLSSIFMEHFIERGGKIVSATYCQSKDRTLSEQVTSIIAAKPDIIYLANHPARIVLTCKSLVEADLRISVITSVRTATDELIQEGKDAVEGLTIPGYFDRQAVTSDMAHHFMEAYKEGTGKETTVTQALAVDSYFLLVDAIERAQSPEGHNIRKALTETKNFNALTGRISIDTGGKVLREVVFHRIKEGKLEYVTKLTP